MFILSFPPKRPFLARPRRLHRIAWIGYSAPHFPSQYINANITCLILHSILNTVVHLYSVSQSHASPQSSSVALSCFCTTSVFFTGTIIFGFGATLAPASFLAPGPTAALPVEMVRSAAVGLTPSPGPAPAAPGFASPFG